MTLPPASKDRNEYLPPLCFLCLSLDDFGMERGTEYGLEQVYNVIDSRYRSGKAVNRDNEPHAGRIAEPGGHRPRPDL